MGQRLPNHTAPLRCNAQRLQHFERRLLTIQKLLGHGHTSTTTRYLHMISPQFRALPASGLGQRSRNRASLARS